ncbi:extracellular serine protease [Grosmannia clavigera kw1407]|uniref:Extracellular serine protease n=1 Tax=Grosmannia clavigera (strain kw1407 / UAMH 11150) TaxID=655863 RepID=F0XET7_GROCL|nr:extracellular serine protease [Grosmannia clavigera kw1407]EFX04389.1 extracellular serine protease [Grosmannia clavigera kw1407]
MGESPVNLAAHIDFIGHDRREYDFGMVAKRLRDIKRDIKDLFHDPKDELRTYRGIAGALNNDEIDFIRRTKAQKKFSEFLYENLKRHNTCPGTHKARLHLSGFVDNDVNIDLINEPQPQEKQTASGVRTRSKMKLERHTCLSIGPNANELILCETQSRHVNDFDQDSRHLLPDLLSRRADFNGSDLKMVQLLVASSLLNATLWLKHAELDITSISFDKSSESTWPWKLGVDCTLEGTLSNDIHYDAAVSFGLFLIETERGERIQPTDEEQDWESGLWAKDSTLFRVLGESGSSVTDPYRYIALACLEINDATAEVCDERLTKDMLQIATLYRHIFAPLYKFARESYHQISAVTRARQFRTEFKTFINMISSLEPINVSDIERREKIKIAVIDSGIDKGDTIIAENMDRIKYRCGFVSDAGEGPRSGDCEDELGHGTHVTRLILEMAPEAELYVAKISDKKTIQSSDLHRLVRAIEWACKKKVHIISLSLGIDMDNNRELGRAIQAARDSNITIFAAASNGGGNKPRSYPASRPFGVICVHASDGLGNKGGINPTPLKRGDNFLTLGIGIESKWKGNDVIKSGTSFATPVMVAIVANVLKFALHKCDLDSYRFDRLREYDGVCQILRLMARERDQYDYVMPNSLFGRYDDNRIKHELLRISDP